MVLAIKYCEDFYYDNEFYSQIGGITCREMNGLEMELLLLLDYDLHVRPEIYESYSSDLLLQRHCGGFTFGKKETEVISKSSTMLPQISSQSSIKTVPSSSDFSHEEASH